MQAPDIKNSDSALVFLDLETTGTRTTYDRITEIAALRVIEDTVVDRFVTLINPGKSIPPFIQQLTGISDAMVSEAPEFDVIANDFFAWLGKDTIVAHNARFDYGFLRNEFSRAGLNYTAKVICTLKLSRRLEPNHPRHNLDELLTRHGLGGSDRHRAESDAQALFSLWQHWRKRHDADYFEELTLHQMRQASLPAHLDPFRLQTLPERPGVYLFYGENRAVLYVGKSVNMRSRVLSHFSNDVRNDREMRLVQQIHDIDWHETAGDLGAQLLEAHLIKTLMPVHNRLLRRQSRLVSWSWPEEQTRPTLAEGNQLISAEALALYGLFRSRRDADKALKAIADEQRLCTQTLGLSRGKGRCFDHQLGRCLGACCGEESLEAHADRAREALERLRVHQWPWGGRVAFGETAHDGTQAWHIVDHWCYLGSIERLDASQLATLAQQQPRFDVDTYKILNRFLAQKADSLEVRPLD